MTTQRYSDAYVAHLSAGPFPGRIDPWAEDDHYFQQIHAGMIDYMLGQLHIPLARMGYRIGREASLQILEGREPDVFIHRHNAEQERLQAWDYTIAAAELLAEPGVRAENRGVGALKIVDMESGGLVTIIEIISPGNKLRDDYIAQYQDRRRRTVYYEGVNLVEIDLTRSVKRLFPHPLTESQPYHTMIYLPFDLPYVVVFAYDEALKRIALPLRSEAVGVDLQKAYQHGYEVATIPAQMRADGHYVENNLPFPTLLTAEQRRDSLDAAARWKEELERLRTE